MVPGRGRSSQDVATVRREAQRMSSTQSRPRALSPNWFEPPRSVPLLSGPPQFRGRDPLASLQGAIDPIVLLHVGVWSLGGLWVLARLYSSLVRRGVVPSLDSTQIAGILLIAGL